MFDCLDGDVFREAEKKQENKKRKNKILGFVSRFFSFWFYINARKECAFKHFYTGKF
jgi:hypothetical protein